MPFDGRGGVTAVSFDSVVAFNGQWGMAAFPFDGMVLISGRWGVTAISFNGASTFDGGRGVATILWWHLMTGEEYQPFHSMAQWHSMAGEEWQLFHSTARWHSAVGGFMQWRSDIQRQRSDHWTLHCCIVLNAIDIQLQWRQKSWHPTAMMPKEWDCKYGKIMSDLNWPPSSFFLGKTLCKL